MIEPLNIRWATPENAFALRVAGANILLVDDTFVEQGSQLLHVYAIFYTSGTTAPSKSVVLSHDSALFTALTFGSTISLSTETRHLHLLDFLHVGGAQPLWYTTMAAGTHVIHQGFGPSVALEAIATHHITNTVLVPTMMSMPLHQPDLAD